MPFEIVRNDLTHMQVDAIVNTANPNPIIGNGVDHRVHKKAGGELLKARMTIGKIDVGDAAITPAYKLSAQFVIHAVGPVWEGGQHGEEMLLASCYRKSLKLAKENHLESIAFPLISTGNYGFPTSLALRIAVQEFSAFLLENEMQIYLVVFNREAFALSEKLFRSVRSYIDENYVQEKTEEEYGKDNKFLGRSKSGKLRKSPQNISLLLEDSTPIYSGFFGDVAQIRDESLASMLNRLDAGFSETLLRLIDKTGKKDSEIYKKANVDRKLFSKIKNNPDYKPSKTTALAFAFALEMTLEETKEFISRAGYALSHSNQFDVIVEYFLVHRNFDLFELNEVLFAFDQPLIGA